MCNPAPDGGAPSAHGPGAPDTDGQISVGNAGAESSLIGGAPVGVGLIAPWWEWSEPKQARSVVEARAVAQPPSVAPFLSGVVPIGGEMHTFSGRPGDLAEVCVSLPADAIRVEGGVTYFAVDLRPSAGRTPWRVWRRYTEFRELAQLLERDRMPTDALRSMTRLSKELFDIDRFAKFSPRRVVRPSSTVDPCRSRTSDVDHSYPPRFMFSPWPFSCAGARFPRRHFRSCVGDKLEARREALQAWLQNVVDTVDYMLTVTPEGMLAADQRVQVRASGRTGRVLSHDPDHEGGDVCLVRFDDGRPPATDALAHCELDALPRAWRPWMSLVYSFLHRGRTALLPLAPLNQRRPTDRELVCLEVDVPADLGPGQHLQVVVPGERGVAIAVPSRPDTSRPLTLWYDPVSRMLGVAGPSP